MGSQTPERRRPRVTEAELGVMPLQPRKAEDRGRLQSPEGEPGPAGTLTLELRPPELNSRDVCCLSHPVCDSLRAAGLADSSRSLVFICFVCFKQQGEGRGEKEEIDSLRLK